MTLTLLINHNSHPQGPVGQTCLNQELAFEKLHVLAVARSIIRLVPPIHHTPVILIRHRQDNRVDVLVDPDQRGPHLRGKRDLRGLRAISLTFLEPLLTKPNPGPDRNSAFYSPNGLGIERQQ